MQQAMARRQGNEMLGTTLVRLGHLSAADLTRATRDHVRRVTLLVLGLQEGEWEFAVGALPFREQLDAGVRTSELILEWSRLLIDPDWVHGRLGPDDCHVKRERRPPEGYQDIHLDSAEGFIMSRVDGASTAREIGMVSPMGDARTSAALLGLVLCGLLERPAGGGASPIIFPEPTAAPEPPAPARPATAAMPPASNPAPRPVGAAPPAPATAPVPATPRAPVTPPVTAAASATPKGPAAGPGGAPPLRLVTTPAGAPRPGAAKPGAAKPGSRPLRPAGKGSTRPGGRPALVAKRPLPPPKPTPASTSAELEREMMIRFEQIDALDLYQSLGVARGAPVDEVRRAYYALTRRFHPDKFQREELKPNAEKVFARITEAYATLSHAEARQRYDAEEALKSSGRGSDRPADTHDLARLNYRSGREHLERGKLAEALGFFANACQQDPTKAEYFESLGAIQARNPRLRREAEENLNRALELAPTSASPYVHLGGLYERSGNVEKAIETYRAALKWEPDNKAAAEALDRLAPSKKGLLGLFSRH
jgi:DnaJ-domain-containing protein 1